MKVCIKCLINKDISEFHKKNSSKDGHHNYCKLCSSTINKYKYNKDLYLNREKAKKQAIEWKRKNPLKYKIIQEKYRGNNREQIIQRNRIFRNKNREKLNEYSKRKYNKDKEIICKRNKERYKIDYKFKLDNRISMYIGESLKGNKNGWHWEYLVGYTLNDLKIHIESKFTKGMNWDEYLNGNIEIDHILPKELFEFEHYNDPLFKICWGLENLQPLWAKDNGIKLDKLPNGCFARNLTKEQKINYLKNIGYNI